MREKVFGVFLCACSVLSQFHFPSLSRFVPSNPSGIASGRILFSSPTTLHQSEISPLQPEQILNSRLTAPPPSQSNFIASPRLEEGPLRILDAFRPREAQQNGFLGIIVDKQQLNKDAIPSARNIISELKNIASSETAPVSAETTLTPLIASPTTLKFTLEDVPNLFEQVVVSSQTDPDKDEQIARVESLSILENPLENETKNDENSNAPHLLGVDSQQHVFILTSTENTLSSSSEKSSARDQSLFTPSSILNNNGSSFKPSLSLPFLDQSTESSQNLFTLVETRNPKISSFLRSEAPHFIDRIPKVIALRPLFVKPQDATEVVLKVTDNKEPRKTPVPKPIYFSNTEGDKIQEVADSKPEQQTEDPETTVNKTLSTRKSFHFEQEFLSLLKKNSPIVKSLSESTASTSEPLPFWFSEQNDEKKARIWNLKGEIRAPIHDLLSESSVISQTSLPSNLGGVFATSFRGLSPTSPKSDESIKIVDDADNTATTEGISVKSLAQEGLSRDPVNTATTTIRPLLAMNQNASPTTLKARNISTTTHPSDVPLGPQIVPVGEVGEVPHDTDSATVSPVPALSAALKHGVQSLNVTAWVSGCPKLYGKVELNCVIEHDAFSNTAMMSNRNTTGAS
ncbi:hypothetical protein SK128_022264 [Halocaridina rubra]|uniref:Uncharacterized protein n=1 Tax=Halocaridina rubra TaxID=373956 RepID=A0AAN8ZUL6_HALRR